MVRVVSGKYKNFLWEFMIYNYKKSIGGLTYYGQTTLTTSRG
jgi:hypothetical protein